MSTETKIREQLDLLQFDAATVDVLSGARPFLEPKLDAMVDEFYQYVTEAPATRAFFPTEASIVKARNGQSKHWRALLFGGIPGEDYFLRAHQIGLVHEKIGLTMNPYLAGYCHLLNSFSTALAEAEAEDRAGLTETLIALQKAAFFDIACVIDSYIESKNFALRRILQNSEQFANEVEPLEAEVASQCHHLAEQCAKMVDEMRELRHKLERPEEAGSCDLPGRANNCVEQAEMLTRRAKQLALRLDRVTETAKARRDLHKLHFSELPKPGLISRLVGFIRSLTG